MIDEKRQKTDILKSENLNRQQRIDQKNNQNIDTVIRDNETIKKEISTMKMIIFNIITKKSKTSKKKKSFINKCVLTTFANLLTNHSDDKS